MPPPAPQAPVADAPDTAPSVPKWQSLTAKLGHAPQTLRALVRRDEIWLILLACMLGAVAGSLVVAMNQTAQLLHETLFGLAPGERLSGQAHLENWTSLVPAAGGLALGASGLILTRWFPKRPVDAIEANALYGGRLSLTESCLVVFQTLLSNGVGASVGLEAGYTQIGAAVGSKLGRSFRVRRADMRLLVGCGAAGAIAAAFNAPLTGAFYAFELIIGTYSLVSLAPVVGAALCAVFVQRMMIPDPGGLSVDLPDSIATAQFLPVIGLGILCALAGITVMRAVTLTETAFSKSRVPGWLRPAIGGAALGALAMVTPSVLSAGHGALRNALLADIPLLTLLFLLALKAIASAISLGSGFRGGLFFASLYLGALLGKAFGAVVLMLAPDSALPGGVYGFVGMSGMAAAIIGGPLTMAFLALESTGSLPLTVAVLAASTVCSVTVRRVFGYSFATWRFHLRGEAIRSAVDVGWVRELTVERMMRRDVRSVPARMTLAEFCARYPLGSGNRVIATDEAGAYAGIVLVAEAHAPPTNVTQVAPLLHHASAMLIPGMSVKEAVEIFASAEADALAVVDDLTNRRVLGILTEQHALRRYNEELEKRRRDISGE